MTIGEYMFIVGGWIVATIVGFILYFKFLHKED